MVRGTKNIKRRWKKPENSKPIRKNKVRTPFAQILKGAGWERKLGLKTNFAIVGLALDPNADLRKKSKSSINLETVKKYRKYDLGNKLGKEVNTKANMFCEGQTESYRPKNYLSEDEIRYLGPLVEKYGSDVDKMFKDIKLNYWQRTKGWLRKRVAKYLARDAVTTEQED